MKPVLLIVIDALASRVIRPAMEQGKLPNLQALADAGQVDWNSTAIFPSITPAATAALVTGGYPCETGIAGAYYYDQDNDHVHYYADDLGAIMRKGFSDFVEDFMIRLNRDHLRANTALREVEKAGYRAACLNYLWFLGDVSHTIDVPWLLKLWPTVPWSHEIQGPSTLSLGDFVSDLPTLANRRKKGAGGIFNRFGFNDESTAADLLYLAEAQALPDFTIAYFPDNDFNSHSDGPAETLPTVEKVDQVLGKVAQAYGGMEALLHSMAVVVTGDHSQSDLPMHNSETGINVDTLLKDYSVVPAGQDWENGEQLMICPNMRAAQIYLRPRYWDLRKEIIERLLADPRIDQVMWREKPTETVRRYSIQTQRHGLLAFHATLDGQGQAKDEYGMSWTWEGNLATIDTEVGPDGVLVYGDYPNALERITTAFDDEVTGDLWGTCHLDYEFRLESTGVHRRGSHGSLHAEDSLSPLILAGVPEELYPTKTPRSVDVAPLCLAILGIKSRQRVGSSHVRGPGSG
ncbi:MAG: alkaline phosphatase family protein [Pirellulaceae bacterium]